MMGWNLVRRDQGSTSLAPTNLTVCTAGPFGVLGLTSPLLHHPPNTLLAKALLAVGNVTIKAVTIKAQFSPFLLVHFRHQHLDVVPDGPFGLRITQQIGGVVSADDLNSLVVVYPPAEPADRGI